MIRKFRSPRADHIRIVFELPSGIWADRVYLTGDFNDWRKDDIRLVQNRSGVWQTSLELPLGRQYQFRYLIDGQWRTDSNADGHAINEFGSENSLIDTTLLETDQAVLSEELDQVPTPTPSINSKPQHQQSMVSPVPKVNNAAA